MTKPFAMIVEDDPKLGIIYEAALQQAGYDTYLDKDGDQVMDKLSSVDPALIILDMHLPYASGADILRQIRSDKRWAKVPIIVATADLFAAKSLQGQAEYVLVKPVSVGRLLEITSHLRDKMAENSSNDLDEKEKLP
jgi:DNA-binding response OmpR family regulator